MAYEVHITRSATDGPPITLQEWLAAVSELDGVRLCTEPVVSYNPVTREQVAVPCNPGDAEVWVDDHWLRVFRFSGGEAHLRPRPSFEDRADPVRKAAERLAWALDAQLIGDEGERLR